MSVAKYSLALFVGLSTFRCATCYDSDYSDDYDSSGSADLLSFVLLLFILGNLIGTCAAFAKARELRRNALAAARRGEAVQPPEDCCVLWCCGAAAIYYWEGASANCMITYFIWPYYALCCWEKSPVPLENGIPVAVSPPPPSVAVVQAVPVHTQPPVLLGHAVQVSKVPGQTGLAGK
mmetsp:Transcript_112394/g.324689  ORF Transcript_112394/g.324689 Transcript_112394/m.324689 type:complete len:178 (+) Transcript_112394:96-629(+)|eukprot:CAMPEP_0176072242 /NCGR_PEP_ID=MMETSP0120_2-20121206/36089_1 /TAXON_ID=160619 /ORGANISM="Kryptoperidinium foliaceum, Strain CCMP 1326" /LENGTH=177 /DNA_ID=CAMNT_0017405911 /DNA_START=88 /DNA_END=621 /DNA_ORIENTATION=+